jgi:pimeloyl-ACP methyl ester carboxylesterase
MAAQDPDLIKRMFLYEPTLATVLTAAADAETAYVDSVEMSLAAMKLADSGDLPGTVRRSMDDANAQEGAFDSLSPDVRQLMTDNARMLPLSFAGPPPPLVAADDLRRLQIPTTIALGAQSRSFYRIVTETVQSLLPNAEFELVESARHLWPVQDPPAFSRLVLEWLENG